MAPRWVVLVACLCAFAAQGYGFTLPTTETLVVKRTDVEQETASPVSENSSDDVSATTEVSEASTDGPTPPIKLQKMDVLTEVSLRYAHTAVVTRVRNPARTAQEATFRVLLPETAFISGFTMTLDGKSYKAYVKEKEEAKQIYSEAVSHGIGAAHISAKARDSNHFTVSVNVEANTTAMFNLTYEELLTRRGGVYNLAMNLHPGALVPKLTVTVHLREAQRITSLRVPEVRTGNEIDAIETDPQNSNAVITRGHDDREATITFSPDLEEQRRLMDIYAEKSKESQQAHSRPYSWGSEQEDTQPEGVLGQFVVQYDVDRPQDGEILVNDGYFVHFFAPSSLPPLSKHVVFVLDTSGSMMDRKIAQLREAMQTILSELNQGDYFSIVEFASSVKVYDLKEADEPKPQRTYSYFSYDYDKATTLVPPSPATKENVDKAKIIVSRLEANGGTNIYSALNVAVELIQKGVGWTQPYNITAARPTPVNDTPKLESQAATSDAPVTAATTPEAEAVVKDESKKLEPIIIFLTDGDPTVGESDPTRIINHLTEKNFGENKASIFSLAFGEDADRKFLRKLSLRNEGFMRHIYEAADAALQLRDFYRQVASPLLADVHFVYPPEQVKEGSLTKNKFRAFYAGSEAVVAGRLVDGGSAIAPHVYGVCGVDDGFTRKRYEVFPKVPSARPSGQYLPLERLWAYLTVKQLLDARDAAESAPSNDTASLQKKALDIALKYEFVTPLTSLVVVKPNATKAVDAESVDKQQDFGPPSHGIRLMMSRASLLPLSYRSSASGFSGYPSYSSSNHYDAGGASTAGFNGYSSYSSSRHFGRADAYSANVHLPSSLVSYPRSSGLSGSRQYFGLSPYRPTYPGASWSATGSAPSTLHYPSAVPPMLPPLSTTRAPEATPLLPEATSASPKATSASPEATLASSETTPSHPDVTPNPLIALHLSEFPWVRALLAADRDAILLQGYTNDTTVLELTRDVVVPKEASGDAECARATDGAPGACVYLTRCAAARSLSAAEYSQTYCQVNAKYAGVCCPRQQVDLPAAV